MERARKVRKERKTYAQLARETPKLRELAQIRRSNVARAQRKDADHMWYKASQERPEWERAVWEEARGQPIWEHVMETPSYDKIQK